MTEKKPEILFLAHRIPYPPDKGDKIRSWRLLQHLTQQFSVHLACFVDDPQDFAHTEFLSSICETAVFIPLNPIRSKIASLTGLLTEKALSVRYFDHDAMARAVQKVRQRPLVAEIVFSSTMAQYIAKPVEGRARIVDFCDADSEKWKQYSNDAIPALAWVYRREADTLARTENRIANWADASFAITPDEASIFNHRSEIRKNVGWWSNGVDTNYFDPALKSENETVAADLVFTGAMDYRANIDAVLCFYREVWPHLRKALPKVTFAIVGSNPAKQVMALDGKDGITVTGRVDDIRPWIKNAKVSVAPMRVARGVQNKVLEAMAMATPVVATREAAVGIVAEVQSALKVIDRPSDMASVIASLITDETARKRVGILGREAVATHYDWDNQLKRFDDLAMPIIFGQSDSSNSPPSKLASSY